MARKVRKNFMIFNWQDRKLDDKVDEADDVDRSWLIRRALIYYFKQGIKHDKKFQRRKHTTESDL